MGVGLSGRHVWQGKIEAVLGSCRTLCPCSARFVWSACPLSVGRRGPPTAMGARLIASVWPRARRTYLARRRRMRPRLLRSRKAVVGRWCRPRRTLGEVRPHRRRARRRGAARHHRLSIRVRPAWAATQHVASVVATCVRATSVHCLRRGGPSSQFTSGVLLRISGG